MSADFSSSSQTLSQQGSQLKDLELVGWLEKKLNDRPTWNGRGNAALLSNEILVELETCFQSLDVQCKLKLLLALSHVNPRLMAMWKDAAQVLLGICRRDAEEWVETIAELYRELPQTGVILTNTSSTDSQFSKTAELLRKELHTILGTHGTQMLPEGYAIASNTIIKEQFGEQRESNRHFNLRKKPKSFSLLKEIERQCESQIALREQKGTNVIGSTIPIKFRSTLRKANNDLPMKGIPTQNSIKLNSGFTAEPRKFQRTLVKREGGAKLLDIAEIPQSLKKRKIQEAAEEKKRKIEEKEYAKQRAAEEKKLMIERKKQELQKVQEEAKKAAEKPKLTVKTEAAKGNGKPAEEILKSPPVPQKSPLKSPAKPTKTATSLFNTDLDTSILKTQLHIKKEAQVPETSVQTTLPPPPQPYFAIPTDALRTQATTSAFTQQPPQQSSFMRVQHQQPAQTTQNQPTYSTSQQSFFIQPNLTTTLASPSIQLMPITSLQQRNLTQQQPSQMTQSTSFLSQQPRPSPSIQLQPARPPPLNAAPAYANISVPSATRTLQDELRAREEMITKQCNDMLGSANVLDAAGRQMILSFMSGNKNNPRPELGNQLTLKLSESLEDVYVDNRMGKMKVETFFQMDYSSGEWKRLRKSRILQSHEINPPAAEQAQQLAQIQLSLVPGGSSAVSPLTMNLPTQVSSTPQAQPAQQAQPGYLYLQQFVNQKPFGQY